MSNIDPEAWRAATNALRSVDRATGCPSLIAPRCFLCTRIGVATPRAPIRAVSAISFQRGHMKNARSFFFAISNLVPIIPATSDAPIKAVRRLQQTVHIILTRSSVSGVSPVRACLDAFVSTDRGARQCRTPATPQLRKLAARDPLLKCNSPQCRGHLNAKNLHMNLRWKSVVILPKGLALQPKTREAAR
jgi:hypothetical protein